MAVKSYKKGTATQLSANFKSTEFDCHGSGCCSSTLIDEDLVNYVQKIRNHFGKPVNISSAYRCNIHNKNVGGATGSRHKKGEAADIYIKDVAPIEIAQYAETIGILGIGLYETNKDGFFVHIDTRDKKAFWYGQAQEPRDTFLEKEEVKLDTSKVNTAAADPKVMWNYFKSQGLNDYGVAGLMGNLFAESGLRPVNLQNSHEKKLGMTDAEYTLAVDTGIYTNFIKDGAGYGLAQWTYWSLKQDMLNYFQKRNKSIGDLNTQMEFLVHQLSTDYKAVWETLKTATSVLEASNAVLLKFERPADQSINVQNKRAEYGQKYYDDYANKIVESDSTEQSSHKNKNPFFNQKNKLTIDNLKIRNTAKIVSKIIAEIVNKKKPQPDPTTKQMMVQITASVLNIRAEPNTSSTIVGQTKAGDKHYVYEIQGEWGRIESGWIYMIYTKKV